MYSVMVVDDLKFAREELKTYDFWGEKTGFIISAESENGREALTALRKQPVDLMITDIRMPLIDGIDLTKIALEENLCKYVILMSQFSDFEYARKGMSYGAFEYLLKPIEKEHLLSALQRVSQRINVRAQELIKISYVDQVLRCDDSYPYDQFKMLIRNIETRAADSGKIAADIFETIQRETNSDVIKSLHYLTRILDDMTNAVNVAFPWINKLTASAERKAVTFPATGCWDDIKDYFVTYINEMDAFISNYELGQSDNGIIRTACRYVLENIDAPINLNSLSRKLFISNTYLSSLFKKKTGINVNEYITRVKLERSKVLLQEGVLRNYEIAAKIGFNYEYFSKLFKKCFNMSPSEFRKQLTESS